MKIELPTYENNELAAFTTSQLIERMIEDEDRVPRNLIDECVKRGELMLQELAPIAKLDAGQGDKSLGHWWLQLHAIMIIGLIPGERSGMLLIEFFLNMCRDEDASPADWFSGYWTVLIRNKPQSVINRLRELCMDKKISWFMRSNLTEAVVANAYWQGAEELEQTLNWAAQIVTDEEEDWDYRLATANTLLDFPRDHFYQLLNDMAARQSGFGVSFDKKDINRAYSEKTDQPAWERLKDLWSFYESQQIESRQQRWREEAKYDEIIAEDPDDEKVAF